jgi:hypothetical protein
MLGKDGRVGCDCQYSGKDLHLHPLVARSNLTSYPARLAARRPASSSRMNPAPLPDGSRHSDRIARMQSGLTCRYQTLSSGCEVVV